MRRRQFIYSLIGQSVVGTGLVSMTGCGTLLHPERRGQAHSVHLDWKVVALDGLGLLLFFIPGIIAFTVDFYTGAIYLPVEEAYPGLGAAPVPMPPPQANNQQPFESRFRQVALHRSELPLPQIESIVSEHVGSPVVLEPDTTRLSPLAQIDQFDSQLQRHHADRSFGKTLRAFFS